MRNLKIKATTIFIFGVVVMMTAFYVAEIRIGENAILVLIPLVLLINIVVSATIGRIKCQHCHQKYGIKTKQYGWIDVPDKCISCGQKP